MKSDEIKDFGCRTEEYFVNYLKFLTPNEILNLTRAIVKVMNEINGLSDNIPNVKRETNGREVS